MPSLQGVLIWAYRECSERADIADRYQEERNTQDEPIIKILWVWKRNELVEGLYEGCLELWGRVTVDLLATEP